VVSKIIEISNRYNYGYDQHGTEQKRSRFDIPATRDSSKLAKESFPLKGSRSLYPKWLSVWIKIRMISSSFAPVVYDIAKLNCRRLKGISTMFLIRNQIREVKLVFY
jgi:hypothetical protein